MQFKLFHLFKISLLSSNKTRMLYYRLGKDKIYKIPHCSWAQWRTPVILVLRRLRQEDCRFKASLSNLVRLSAT